jgi:Na+/H+-translocating membrane pyrophosphatase
MAATLQDLFTPIFITVTLMIFIGGIVGMQFLDKLFAGSKNLQAIRIFAISIILNIIILIFILMSFSKIKFVVGPNGPQGNKGYRGMEGAAGGLVVCKPNARTAQEQKALKKSEQYLDLKPPYLEEV